MPGIQDFLNSFSYDPNTFNEEEFKAAALRAYGEDTEHHTAELTQRDERITTLDTKNRDMGQALWDLQMKQGPKVTPPDPSKTPNPDAGNGDHTPKSIDSMFKPIERK